MIKLKRLLKFCKSTKKQLKKNFKALKSKLTHLKNNVNNLT